MLKRIGAMARDATAAIGVTAILFLLVNLAAAYALRQQRFPPTDPLWNAVYSPFSPQGIGILQEVFGTDDPREALSRSIALPYTLHPVLGYAMPATNQRHYHIGIENIRYQNDWSDDEVRRRLASDHLTLILGGSTTFGVGVSNNETWPYYFDQAIGDRGEVSLNLGTIAYDQAQEIDRLVYHLRQGLRPRRVIFLDGLNDMLVLGFSNLRVEDRVVYETFMPHRGEVAVSDGLRFGERNWWRVLAEGLPAVKWLEQKLEPERSGDQIVYPRDAFTQGFDFREAEWARYFWYKWAPPHAEQLRAALLRQYEANLDVINALSKSFGFEPLVFYQPIGVLDPKNRFVTEAAQQTAGYGLFKSVDEAVRGEIRSGHLSMIDIHSVLDPLERGHYVDINHYSPAAHQLIAAAIFAHLKPLSP